MVLLFKIIFFYINKIPIQLSQMYSEVHLIKKSTRPEHGYYYECYTFVVEREGPIYADRLIEIVKGNSDRLGEEVLELNTDEYELQIITNSTSLAELSCKEVPYTYDNCKTVFNKHDGEIKFGEMLDKHYVDYGRFEGKKIGKYTYIRIEQKGIDELKHNPATFLVDKKRFTGMHKKQPVYPLLIRGLRASLNIEDPVSVLSHLQNDVEFYGECVKDITPETHEISIYFTNVRKCDGLYYFHQLLKEFGKEYLMNYEDTGDQIADIERATEKIFALRVYNPKSARSKIN